MNRTTVDFGIDLGTTNSSIAVFEGPGTKIIRTNERAEYTPSVVAFDSKNRMRIGELAKNQIASVIGTESEDVALEFKLRMGHPDPFRIFTVNKKGMTPEELSAEILKKLKNDVHREMMEDITAAAISVPAAFEQPGTSATIRAAQLAGLSLSPLIQEPVAAALTYGFQTQSDRVFWLVYDFGGGTFDAAIIQVRDEQIQVVNHGGDNHLGGKLIDWEIVNQLLIPVVIKEYKLTQEYIQQKRIGHRLKLAAEKAKIRLSVETETELHLDQLYIDDDGKSIPFEYELKRSDLERFAEPFILRSINKCHEVLKEARLNPSDIEKIILVGGPTLTPMFREMIREKTQILLETKEDPLTVVARGAAIFAGTQIIPNRMKKNRTQDSGQIHIELDYQPIGDDTKPVIGGKVIPANGQSLRGYTIEFIEKKWQSGKISLNENGGFTASLFAEKGRKNEYRIELRDEKGKLYETIPDNFSYTIGITITAQPLVNNIGIALSDGTVALFFKKNTPLPTTARRIDLVTSTAINSGNSGTFLRIPVVEGNNDRADRNHLVGYLEVSGNNISRDLAQGTNVEVTLEINESRSITIKAYIPLLDEDFENVFEGQYSEIPKNDLEQQIVKVKQRLNEINEKVKQVNSSEAQEILEQIENTGCIQEIDTSLKMIDQQGTESADRCQSRRIELDVKLDQIEDLIEWPALVFEAQDTISQSKELIGEHGDSQDKADLSRLETDIQNAISTHNTDFLRQRVRNLSQLLMEVLMKQPGFWVAQLERIASDYRENMTDKTEADRLISQGYSAIHNEDIDGLKETIRQLYRLLPNTIVEDLKGYRSTIMKDGL